MISSRALSGDCWRHTLGLFLILLLCVPVLRAQCVSSQDYRSKKEGGIVISRAVLSGTRALSSDELAQIRAGISGSCLDDDGEDLSSLLEDQFRQRGYFDVKVANLKVDAIDPLAIPRTVEVKADIAEGPAYRLAAIDFSGNRVFPAARLAAEFPVKPGAVFDTSKIRSGQNAIRELYATEGYLDALAVPATELHSNQTASLKIALTEGKQYRMGKLQVVGQPDQAGAVQARWSLPEGAPFDESYLDRFAKEHKDLLPSGFNPINSVQVRRNCREATVAVFIFLGENLNSFQPPAETGCQKDADASSGHP